MAIECDKEEVELVATLKSEKTGRKLEVFTDLPGMHFYTGNWVSPKVPVKDNAKYDYWQGVCFETQHFPNACNVPAFPNSAVSFMSLITSPSGTLFFIMKSGFPPAMPAAADPSQVKALTPPPGTSS